MLASFYPWWLARISELLPSAWTDNTTRQRDGIVIDATHGDTVAASVRRAGRLEPISLGAAVRRTGRKSVFLKPPAETVLVKQHIVPAAPLRQLDQVLRYELARITPFPADALFWRWDPDGKTADGSRINVTLTMVPKIVLSPALAAMENAGLKADFVEVEQPGGLRLLPMKLTAGRAAGTVLIRGLAWGCGSLAVVAIVLPFVLQALALRATDNAIDALQPAITQVEALRRGIAAGDAGRDVVARASERTGDVLQILATVTRILPDDTYLTDFSLRDRQMTLSGRSASAPRLITGLSSDPAIRNTAFAAPVTRIEGATSDVFSIKAEVAQ